MAFDEQVAGRIRSLLHDVDGVEERRMFGGLSFLLNGHMCCGVLDDRLVLRLGDEAVREAPARKHTAPMDFTGRPLRSMVYMAPPGFAADGDLEEWLEQAVGFARTLPPKARGGSSR